MKFREYECNYPEKIFKFHYPPFQLKKTTPNRSSD